MQRGAQRRDVDPSPATNKELYSVSPPRLTDAEISHYHFGNRDFDSFFSQVSDILAACHHGQLPAGHIAQVLNKKNIKTARGGKWTPRLAWFLMVTWRTVQRASIAASKTKSHQSEPERAGKVRGRRREDAIDRHTRAQKKLDYNRAIRKHFENPTWGDAFPELSTLREKLIEKK